MRFPKDLLSGQYTKPKIYLCEVDKTRICELNVTNLKGTFEFNKYSEISFDIGRTYLDEISGQVMVHPFYDKIEALRLVELSEFGYFQLQDPDIMGDGLQEIKSMTAYSLEYDLSQKYLENFQANNGLTGSIDAVLYNPNDAEHSLLHLILTKAYGWSVGYVDAALCSKVRSFEIDRQSIYDFLMNEVADKFNCIVTFDTVDSTINLYAENLIETLNGVDGKTAKFILTHPFVTIGYITIDGYKTNAYTYNASTGEIVFDAAPPNGAKIEVADGYQEKWSTDVFVSFDNLAQQMNVSYSADDIKTVLTVTGADELDIREVNMGLPYIVDLSYYYTVDWMGQDLYDAYTAYLNRCKSYQSQDLTYRRRQNELIDKISELYNRVSTQYVKVSVTAETIGTYYLRSGSPANYYYTEVTLPANYNSNETYYKIDGVNLTKAKVKNLSEALLNYFHDGTLSSNDDDIITLSSVADQFAFVDGYTMSNLITDLSTLDTDEAKELAINNFLSETWKQFGYSVLNDIVLPTYQNLLTTAADAGFSDAKNENYYRYKTYYILLESIKSAIVVRDNEIAALKKEQEKTNDAINAIGSTLLIENNFTQAQLIRLSPFLREDEYSDDTLVVTDSDSDAEKFKTKQELLECGQIELFKLCQPQLSFSATMANIYAIPEFAPIVSQFQLGNLIQVALRPDYIKRTRLMKADIDFEDFSDFSCDFGDLSSVRSASDIHADLLSKAVSAGKSVASNASYWSKGADRSNTIDIKLQQGLLDAITSIKSIDGVQNAEIDNYGIHLRKLAEGSETEYDPEQVWMVNNKILFTDDNFKTTKTVLGKFTYDGQERYGLLADAVVSGYIEGSHMEGGTIKIGLNPDGTYAFEVKEDGTVEMNAWGGDLSERIDSIEQNTNTYSVKLETTGSPMFTDSTQTKTMTCRVFLRNTDVTNSLPIGTTFAWCRISDDDTADAVWNAQHLYTKASNIDTIIDGGFCNAITITPDDVEHSAQFTCEVNIS